MRGKVIGEQYLWKPSRCVCY